MRRQASLGSEDASNVRPQLPRQRSLTTPERDDAKNQTSPPLSELLIFTCVHQFTPESMVLN